MRVPPADADMRRRPEFAKPFLAPFFQTDCVRTKTEKTTQIDWSKWKEQGVEFTSRFLRRYGRKLAHTYATLKLQQPENPSNYKASGLIYGLVDSHANLLYIGKTGKTMQERVAKHWSGRNSKQDQFKRHLQNLPSPPYAFVLYDIPGAFYSDGCSFDRVSEPIEMAFIAMLQPMFNTVRTASDLNRRRKKPRTAPSFTKAPGNERDAQGASRERGEPWVHVDGEEIRINQGRGRFFGIRRQLQHLFGLEEDALREYDVNPWMKSRVYRVRTWVRRFMIEHLQHPKVGILDELLTARLGEINHLAKKKKSAARTPWFCIQQVSKLLDERKLAAIFRHDAQLRALLADPTEFINTRVSTSLNPPLGVLLSNFTEVSRQTTPEPAPPPEDCPCQKYLLQGYHIQGHACGQAHLLDTCSELVTLFDKGRKFRPDGGDEAICTEVDRAVALFVEGYFNDSPPSFARLLREKIMSTVGVTRIGAEPEVTTTSRRRLRELHKDLVILPVDKSSHDFGFVCRRFYNQDLYTKVNHSVNYAPSEKTPEEVVADHKTYLEQKGLSPTNTLPYLYGTLKLHKEVITMRYIAGVSRKNTVGPGETFPERETRRPDATFSSTTDAQLDLTGLLKSVMEILRREDNDRFNATGFRFFWITESSDDTAFFLKTHVDELSGLVAGTWDFTTMYDQLGLEELLEEIAGTIDEAFAAEAERLGVRVDELVLVRPKSQHGPQKKKRCFAFMLLTDLSSQQAAYSAHDLKALLAFCLANTYVLVNGILMRQILGIPMGANASPDIANLFCYAKEKRYMMRLLAERDIRRATLLSMTRRFIDDLLCFGTKPPPESIYSMGYKQTNACVGDATFLGIRIRHEVSGASGRRYMRLSVLDKAKAYPYRPLAYTSVLSTAPSNFGSSILIGALVRNGRIANNIYDFKTEMNNTVLKLMRRGYRKSVLKSGFRKWLLDTYPEAKFGEHCEKVRRHFFWLIHEVERTLSLLEPAAMDLAIERLLAERPFVKYNGRPQPVPEAEDDAPRSPPTEAPTRQADTTAPRESTRKGHKRKAEEDEQRASKRRRSNVHKPVLTVAPPSTCYRSDVCTHPPSVRHDPTLFGPAGLPNLGNTCFFGAVLQLLLRVGPIREMYWSLAQDLPNCRGFLGDFLAYFAMLSSSRDSGDQRSRDCRRMGVQAILSMFANFCDARQHDAHEALVAILSATSATLGPDETGTPCPGYQLFVTCLENGWTSSVRCSACGRTSSSSQVMQCLQIPCGRKLEDSLHVHGFVNPERVCDCKAVGTVVESMDLRLTAECVLMQFGIYTRNGARRQNDVKLPPFFGPPDHLLRLAAVVVHMGEDTASGHYVTYVAQDTGWILFDDLHVTSVDDIPWGDVYLAAFVRIPRNAHDMTVRAPSPSMVLPTQDRLPDLPAPPGSAGNLMSRQSEGSPDSFCPFGNSPPCPPLPDSQCLTPHGQLFEQQLTGSPVLRCQHCSVECTKDGQTFQGLRGLRAHERRCHLAGVRF
ncbi:putative ubiquitin carboxyl-terminal hydrolase 16 [Diplonema papillatum]|nr:putative ubiquitin carboxyl-terminal hydrolase 16 [Diplonema papillatum]